MKMESLMKTKEEWLAGEELELLMKMTFDMEIELERVVKHSEDC